MWIQHLLTQFELVQPVGHKNSDELGPQISGGAWELAILSCSPQFFCTLLRPCCRWMEEFCKSEALYPQKIRYEICNMKTWRLKSVRLWWSWNTVLAWNAVHVNNQTWSLKYERVRIEKGHTGEQVLVSYVYVAPNGSIEWLIQFKMCDIKS